MSKKNETIQEDESISEEIDSYVKMLDELDLYVLKLNTKEEIVGVWEEEDEFSISIVMPVSLLPTYYMIDRWFSPDDDDRNNFYIDGQDPIEEGEDYSTTDKIEEDATAVQQLSSDSPEENPYIYGQDDFEFQQEQHRALFTDANRKRIIPFFHMIEWFQHSDDSVIDINKSNVISMARASHDLKHEYLNFFRNKTKESEFEMFQKEQAELQSNIVAEQQRQRANSTEKELMKDIEEPHFGTLRLKVSQFSSYQSKSIH